MNYYNQNHYPNFPYQNFQTTIPNQNYGQFQPPSIQGPSYKVVDGVEMAKVSDVPIGGYGVFPKADFSEIYLKYWNQNGTTNISIFKPEINEQSTQEEPSFYSEVMTKLDQLEEKINALID